MYAEQTVSDTSKRSVSLTAGDLLTRWLRAWMPTARRKHAPNKRYCCSKELHELDGTKSEREGEWGRQSRGAVATDRDCQETYLTCVVACSSSVIH